MIFPSDLYTITDAAFARMADDGREVLDAELTATRLSGPFRERRLSEAQAHRVIGRIIAVGKDELRALTGRLRGGLATLSGWAKGMLKSFAPRDLAATFALLGTPEPPPADMGAARIEIQRQAGFLDRFRRMIAVGAQPLDGTAEARAALYASAAWGVAQGVLGDRMARDGFDEELWILDRQALHCVDCPPRAELGWVPIGTLPRIGDSVCGPHCRCRKKYRVRAGSTPAAAPMAGLPTVPRFVPSENATSNRDVIVHADISRLEPDLRKDAGFYVGPGGAGGVAGRYEEFRRFLAKGVPVEMARMTLGGGAASFINGRHRFAVLRDLGMKAIPVTVARSEAEAFRRKYGAK